MVRFPLDQAQLDRTVAAALTEDGAHNDLTTIATILSDRRARATILAKEPGIIAGVPLALEAFRLLDPKISMRVDAEDGTRVEKGGTVIRKSSKTTSRVEAVIPNVEVRMPCHLKLAPA